jgi:hypothetical protein
VNRGSRNNYGCSSDEDEDDDEKVRKSGHVFLKQLDENKRMGRLLSGFRPC